MAHIIGQSYADIDPLDRSIGKPFLGHKHVKGDDMAHEIRCTYCGKWVTYHMKDIWRYINEERWDFRHDRLMHCGNSMCRDYHDLVMQDKREKLAEMERESPKLYFNLKKKGLLS